MVSQGINTPSPNSTEDDEYYRYSENSGYYYVYGSQDEQYGYTGYGGYTPLIYALDYGYTELINSLIAEGADIDTQSSSWLHAEGGKTALILSIEEGKTEIVKVLIEAGADINAKDDEGNTALDVATKEGHTDIVALLEKGRTTFQEIGKTYRTTDNLRLRQNEGTAGTALFTLHREMCKL